MNIDVVNRFLALPSDQESWSDEDWQLLFDSSAFFTACSGAEISETLDQLNDLLPQEFKLTSVFSSENNPAGFTDEITCDGRTLRVPYVGSIDDSLIAVLTINELVSHEFDIRLSYESLGNSDHSYLPLSHSAWEELEAKFGAELVGRKFIRLPKSWKELERELENRASLTNC